MQTQLVNYSTDELGYILFNNRSSALTELALSNDATLQNMFVRMHVAKLQGLLDDIRANILDRTIEIPVAKYAFDLNADDIVFNTNKLADIRIQQFKGIFSKEERTYLESRGLYRHAIIEATGAFGLSAIQHLTELHDILGVSLHPTLRKVLPNDISAGLCIPHMQDGKLANFTVRRMNEAKMKYSQAIPNFTVFNTINTKSDTIYLTEGILCMLTALIYQHNAATVSSANWDGQQLFQLLILLRKNSHIKNVVVLADNDITGIRSGLLLYNVLQQILPKVKYNLDVMITVDDKLKDLNDVHAKRDQSVTFCKDFTSVSHYDINDYKSIDHIPFDITKHLIERQIT